MRTDEGNTGGTDRGKVTNKVKKSTERKTKAHHWNNHKLKSRFARREGNGMFCGVFVHEDISEESQIFKP